MNRLSTKAIIASGILAAVVVALTQQNPFFWDTLSQASRRSSWFFDEAFSTILLPYELDSGHPTGFNLYLAAVWSIFGRSLIVSHWAMFPILLGIYYQIYRLVERFFSPRSVGLAFLLIVTDVTLLAQATLVAPDLVLVFGYLLGLRGLVEQRRTWIALGAVLLVMVSLRGVFCLAALGCTALLFGSTGDKKWSIRGLLEMALPFIPAVIVLIAFNGWHYLQTGWVFSTPNPAWAGHREVLGFSGIARNLGILVWRLLDFGRWIYALIFAVALWFWWRNKWQYQKKELQLLLWPGVFLFVLATAMVLLSNPITHRYLLPGLLGLNALGAYLIMEKAPIGLQKWLVALVLISQLTGHFWIYPKHIAQAWDGSLAYLPYFQLREDAIQYAKEEAIPLADIATEFPAIGPLDWHTLSRGTEGFSRRSEATPYLFYATVMNDFSDEELAAMETWTIVWQKSYMGHEAIIYQRPN